MSASVPTSGLTGDQLLKLSQFSRTFADQIDASMSAASSGPYVDLRLSPYNVVANDSSKATLNRTGIDAAITAFAGTGAILQLPPGEIYLDWNSTSSNRSAINLTGVTNFTLRGMGMFGTTIIVQGNAQSSDRYAIAVNKGSTRVTICDLGLKLGTVTNPDPTDQCHGIKVGRDASLGTSNVLISRCYFGQCIGDQVNVQGNINAPVRCVKILDCIFEGQGIAGGARSCVGFQRGISDVTLDGFSMIGAKNSCIDFEPTGDSRISDIIISNGKIDHTLAQSPIAASFGGNSSTVAANAERVTVRDVSVFAGTIDVFDGDVKFINLQQVIDDTATNHIIGYGPNIHAYGDGTFVFENCTLKRKGTTVATQQLISANDHGASHGAPKRVVISGGLYETDYNSEALTIASSEMVYVGGGAHFKYLNPTPSSHNGMTIKTATLQACKEVHIDDVSITSANGALQFAVAIFATGGFDMLDVQVQSVSCPAGQCAIGLKLQETLVGGLGTIDRTPIFQGNNFRGATTEAWQGPTNTAPIIAGNRGGVCTHVCKQTPGGNVAAMQGSWCIEQNGNSTKIWNKTSATDTSGWTQLNIN